MDRIVFKLPSLSMTLGLVCAMGLTGRVALAAEGGGAAAQPPGRQRVVVPGLETTLPMDRKAEETADKHPVTELIKVPGLNWTPQSPENEPTETLYNKASDTLFRRGVWQFQISFRPMRMIRLDLPQPDGKMRRKVIWYMVYRITNPGQHMTPVEGAEAKSGNFEAWHKGLYTIERVDKESQMVANIGPHRFIPIFKLQEWDDKKQAKDLREWLDNPVVPLAKEAIYRREQPPRKLEEFYNTVEIAKKPIPVSTPEVDNSVWGFVSWIGGDPPQPEATDIDPRIDYFSIYIWGLTNAYQWEDPAGAYKPGDPPGTGRKMVQKVLKLNYSRPGTSICRRESEIKYGRAGQLDWEWVYR